MEKNPISWFCPTCEAKLQSENRRDVYYDHELLKFLATKEVNKELDLPELNRIYKAAEKFEIRGDDVYKLRPKGRALVVPSPANRRLFTQVEHEQLGHCGRDKLR